MHHWVMYIKRALGEQPGIIHVQALVMAHHPHAQVPKPRQERRNPQEKPGDILQRQVAGDWGQGKNPLIER